MKFSEEVLKAFDLEKTAERNPVNVMQVCQMLGFMKECSERIHQKSRLYLQCEDADLQLDCMDIVAAKLNDFVQVFKDLVIFIRKSENTHRGSSSLRYCMASFDTFEFHQTEAEKECLRELLLRNEITHDYFNRELHQQRLIRIMQDCSEGAMDVYKNLNDYCTEHDLLDKFADRNA